ncbi:hypothetical protein THAOC_31438 [Thalassiosira oceanica]|uniref:Uncharacterized protein n=1 Tax=Thalassiosira oceanica TaxID=159749 RepID=K0RBM2_THAOC|nr:hypothetical protein THAOC_31438 [Thalassiosira oceanica]|eukprot:EJK49659.1 hypothetical protein THAOC_31438 [Thalassiosira oceanica]
MSSTHELTTQRRVGAVGHVDWEEWQEKDDKSTKSCKSSMWQHVGMWAVWASFFSNNNGIVNWTPAGSQKVIIKPVMLRQVLVVIDQQTTSIWWWHGWLVTWSAWMDGGGLVGGDPRNIAEIRPKRSKLGSAAS